MGQNANGDFELTANRREVPELRSLHRKAAWSYFDIPLVPV